MAVQMTFTKGEIDYVGFELVTEGLTIGATTFKVFDNNLLELETGDATVESSKVFTLIDTSTESYQPGRVYYIYFYISISGSPQLLIRKIELLISK